MLSKLVTSRIPLLCMLSAQLVGHMVVIHVLALHDHGMYQQVLKLTPKVLNTEDCTSSRAETFSYTLYIQTCDEAAVTLEFVCASVQRACATLPA